MKKFLRTLLCFIFIACLGTTVFADSTSSLTISCPVEGMSLSLYRVANFDGDAFTLTPAFSHYPVSLDQKDQEGWQGVANVLENHILADGIQADASCSSNADGKAIFTNLASGLYLVSAQEMKVNQTTYIPQVSLVTIKDSESLETVLKYGSDENIEDESISLHVLKTWKEDSKEKRPSSIDVQLLQTDNSGKTTVLDNQVLNETNQWSYTWENLSNVFTYRVLEAKVPSGYTESSTQEKNTIVLTNTATNTTEKKETKDKELPLTGQLWWPVPLFLLLGIVLFALGKKHEK